MLLVRLPWPILAMFHRNLLCKSVLDMLDVPSVVAREPSVLAFIDSGTPQSVKNCTVVPVPSINVREPSSLTIDVAENRQRDVEKHTTETVSRVFVREAPPLAFLDGVSITAAVESNRTEIAPSVAERQPSPLATVEISSIDPCIEAIQDSHPVEAPLQLPSATSSIELHHRTGAPSGCAEERVICSTCCTQLDTLLNLLQEQNKHLFKLTKAIIQKNVLNSSFTCPNCPASNSNCFTIDEVDETPRPAEIENIEALDNFESMLSDKNVFIATARRISSSLTSNTPDNRMHEAVLKLFSALPLHVQLAGRRSKWSEDSNVPVQTCSLLARATR